MQSPKDFVLLLLNLEFWPQVPGLKNFPLVEYPLLHLTQTVFNVFKPFLPHCELVIRVLKNLLGV